MAFSLARILSKDGEVLAEDVLIWITFFRRGNTQGWDGSFTVPTTVSIIDDAYQVQLDDGRQGTITNINAWITDDSIASDSMTVVYFEGQGPLE